MSACKQGNSRRAALAIAQSEFECIARLAARGGKYAVATLPTRRDERDRQRAALTEHLDGCDQCAEAGVSA